MHERKKTVQGPFILCRNLLIKKNRPKCRGVKQTRIPREGCKRDILSYLISLHYRENVARNPKSKQVREEHPIKFVVCLGKLFFPYDPMVEFFFSTMILGI